MSIDMRLCIEAETDNREEEEKGKSGKYRREKKGVKNFMRHITTLGIKYGKEGRSDELS
jgi:hypothetical protein